MQKATVYRVGKVEVGNHSKELTEFWGTMDAAKPASHPTGRSEAIYVSPNLHGLRRWLSAALSSNREFEVHEIVVDAETVYAYEIDAYERVSPSTLFDTAGEVSERFKANTEKFWSTGMPLADWSEVASPEDGSDTEILLAPEAVVSSKKLSYGQIVARMKKVGMDDYDEMQLKRYKKSFN